MPQVKKIKNNLLKNKNITKNDIENFVSFKGTKIKKNINYQNILSLMTCNVELVQKFRNLAKKKKQRTNTTLINNILRDYFNRLENNNYEDDYFL